MKKYLIEVLEEVSCDSAYYENAKTLIDKISSFDEVDYKYIPDNSLYTEFLGKK